MIELKNVSMAFDDKKVLEDITLTVEEGTALGLVGSNGAGKSTIMRLMCGIYRPLNGRATVDRADVYDNPEAKRKIFFVSDETVQYNNLSLGQIKDYYRSFYKDFSDDIFNSLLDAVSLPLNKKLGTFSKGMKRQAAIITALSCTTPYLVLDEAFDGIDPAMQAIVRGMLIDAMLDRSMTVILYSHNMAQITTLCDSAALIHGGRVIFIHKTEDISENLNKVRHMLSENVSLRDIEACGLDILHTEESGSIIDIIVRGKADEIREKLSSLSSSADILPLTAEEVFIYETEAKGYGQCRR